MRKILTSIILLIFTTCAASATEPADSAKTPQPSEAYLGFMEQADKAIAENKWADAELALKEALRLEPFNPMNAILHSNLGMVQHYNGLDSLALDNLSTAHRLAPNSVTVLLNRGEILTSLHRIPEAIEDYAMAMRLDTTQIEPLFYHAMLCFNSDSIDKAKADMEQLQSRFPDNELTSLALGTFNAFTGKFKEAIPYLNKVIDSTPTAGDYCTRAMCYLMTEQLAEASEDLARGIELDPTDGELYFYRAILNKMRYRPEDAHADALKAVQFGVASDRIKALGL